MRPAHSQNPATGSGPHKTIARRRALHLSPTPILIHFRTVHTLTLTMTTTSLSPFSQPISFSQPIGGWPQQPGGSDPLGRGTQGSNSYSGYGQGNYRSPPPKRGSFLWLWILLGAGAAVVVVCLGCAGIFYTGFNRNMAVMQDDLKSRLASDPVAQDRLGQVSKVELDFMASVQASEGQSEKRMVFHVTGDKGSGDVIGTLQSDSGRETIHNCQLILSSGEEVGLSF
jgi:hypothetical protein